MRTALRREVDALEAEAIEAQADVARLLAASDAGRELEPLPAHVERLTASALETGHRASLRLARRCLRILRQTGPGSPRRIAELLALVGASLRPCAPSTPPWRPTVIRRPSRTKENLT